MAFQNRTRQARRASRTARAQRLSRDAGSVSLRFILVRGRRPRRVGFSDKRARQARNRGTGCVSIAAVQRLAHGRPRRVPRLAGGRGWRRRRGCVAQSRYRAGRPAFSFICGGTAARSTSPEQAQRSLLHLVGFTRSISEGNGHRPRRRAGAIDDRVGQGRSTAVYWKVEILRAPPQRKLRGSGRDQRTAAGSYRYDALATGRPALRRLNKTHRT